MKLKTPLIFKRNENKTEEPVSASSVKRFINKYIISPLPKSRFFKSEAAAGAFYVLGLVITLLSPIYMYFAAEYIYRGSAEECFSFFAARSGAALFSCFILIGIFLIFWLIFKKGFAASFVFTLLMSALVVANYFKHSLTSDFVYPWDLLNQTGNIRSLTDFLTVPFPAKYILVLSVGFMLPVFSFLLRGEIPLRFLPRLLAALMVALVYFLPLASPERIADSLNRFDMTLNSTAEQETNHITNGFVGGFIVNCLSMNVKEPENYSKETVEEIMSKYSGAEEEDFKKPDIIVVLSESFWDVRLLPDTTFSKNPLENYDKICAREGAVSGYMYQTAFGGGTVRTEFEVLTGLSSEVLPVGCVPWQYIGKDTPTYASNYKKIGYRTVFMHTYIPTFYLRDKTYPYLGFDEIYFSEDLTKIDEIPCQISGNYIADDTFADYIKYLLDKESSPCFLFGISMENHQPYEGKYEETEITVKNPKLSDASLDAVTNYANGLFNADKALLKLVDYIDSRERDTVLIYFGDHLPTLGADKAAYIESGFISGSDLTDKDMDAIMKTPFLIYGNFDFNESEILGGTSGNLISSYNLLNAAAELIGAPKTKLMQFLSDYAAKMPYYNSRLGISPSKEQQYFIDAHALLTYDIISGNRYSQR